MLLIVTCKTRLQAIYGSNAYDRICEVLAVYGKTIRDNSGIEYDILAPDDPASAHLSGIDPIGSGDASAIAAAIRAVRAHLAVDSVLLIGGPDIVPFHHLDNTVEGDGDPHVPSDNPYGCATAEPARMFAPDIPVGRITGQQGGGVQSLVDQIARITEFHRSIPPRAGAWALGCATWSPFTTAVAATMNPGAVVWSSPASVVDGHTVADLGKQLLYFNLHGAANVAAWKGAGISGQTDAVTPASLAAADLNGAVVFAANCYGAHIAGKSAADSCALAAVQAGARSFIGSTCFSYGAATSLLAVPQFSDQLAQLFFAKLATASSAGWALQQARVEYVKAVRVGGALEPKERKTALQFIFLGDPTL